MTNSYFQGLYEEGASTPPDRARAHNLALVERGSRFNQAMDKILAKDTITKKYISPPEEILAALDRAYEHFNAEFSGLSSQELMRFFNAFMDIKAHDRMISLYENSKNSDFQNTPVVQERIAVAFNKLGQPAQTIAWIQNALANEHLLEKGLSNAEMYAALGKAHSLQGFACEALIKSQNANTILNYQKAYELPASDPIPNLDDLKTQTFDALTLSRNSYEKGFLDGFSYYPGINVVYGDLALENFEEARKNAELVYRATLRDGGLESADYWTVTTMVEALCILGEGHEQSFRAALDRVAQISRGIPDWRFESTFEKWDAVLKPALEKLIANDTYHDDAEKILQRCQRAEAYLKEAYAGHNFAATAAEVTRTAGEQLLDKSHGYRGMSIFDAEMITNNFSFGGLISHVIVSRRDKQEFAKLLALPIHELANLLSCDLQELPAGVDPQKSLFDVDDPTAFVATAQYIIRQNFGTETKRMEIIDDQGRFRAFDETTRALDVVAGVPESAADRNKSAFVFKTSVTAEFAKGIADCRHHAQSLQLMFDVWQEHKLSNCLKIAHDAALHNERAAALAAFKELERTRLRTIDVQVFAPIQMKEAYRPVRPDNNPEGFVFDPEVKFVESHTMNMFFKLGNQNQIEQASLCCAFYQKVYPWGFMPIDASSIVTNVSGNKPHFEFQAWQLAGVNGAFGNRVALKVLSEGFSGSRTKNVPDDPGEIYERGHVVDNFDIIEALGNRLQTTQQLAAIHAHAQAVPATGDSKPQVIPA